MKKSTLLMGMSVIASLFIGCGTEINISDYPNRVRQPVIVPEVCKNEYNNLKEIPNVAVVKFTNNSNFGKANTTNSNGEASYNKSTVAGIGVGEGIAVAGVASKGNAEVHTNSVNRVVDPKLDKAIQSAFEGVIAEMGGAKVYSREDLDKVIKEQKLQQSGLFDENTLVKLGKLAGVKYIITGSIDSVTQQYDDYEKAAKTVTESASATQKKETASSTALKALVNFGASAKSGMKITTRVTFKIIDTKTGEIVFSKQIEETKNIGKIKYPTYSQIIGGIKDDIMNALQSVKPKLAQFFSLSGYVVQVRADKKREKYIAQINLGTNDKVEPEQTFKVYQFDEVTDPVTGKTSCDKYQLNLTLKVSKNQIQPKSAWTEVEGDDTDKLRAGQIVKRDSLSGSLF